MFCMGWCSNRKPITCPVLNSSCHESQGSISNSLMFPFCGITTKSIGYVSSLLFLVFFMSLCMWTKATSIVLFAIELLSFKVISLRGRRKKQNEADC